MQNYGLIGETLKHSFSPQIHKLFGNYSYELCETDESYLENLINDDKYSGFNVTIPYKKTVMKYLDEISPDALKIGSVNTIVKRNNKLIGYNTDYYGFRYLLDTNGINPKGLKAIILGSGGASTTVKAVLENLGAKVIIISRKGKNNYNNLQIHSDTELIVNTTPVGMFPNCDECPIDFDMFPQCKYAVDLIYNPLRTKFVIEADKHNIKSVGGIAMLVAQAKRASELFTGKAISKNKEKNVIQKILRRKSNIVLIGMPGCGKTLVGKLLARRINRPFYDTDKIIEEKYNIIIKKFIQEKGESEFRKIETAVIKDIGKLNHAVISTGGGAVTTAENYFYLKQNGLIIWLKRDLKKLSTKERPLSKALGVEEIYKRRKDLYRAWCDFSVENLSLKNTLKYLEDRINHENTHY